MKKILALLFLSILLLSCAKEPVPTELNLAITIQPYGGYYVSVLTCTLSGNVTGELKPIAVTSEWWQESLSLTQQKLIYTERLYFSSATTTSFRTIFATEGKYYPVSYFWVKLKWTDATGEHMIESSRVMWNYIY